LYILSDKLRFFNPFFQEKYGRKKPGKKTALATVMDEFIEKSQRIRTAARKQGIAMIIKPYKIE